MAGFDVQRVNDALQDTQFYGQLHHFATIDSTNTRALADAQAGIAMGQIYVADEQTAGRGRGGHAWDSQPDRGLYLTILVRPTLHSSDILKLSMAAGLSAVDAITDITGARRVDLRWPNDLVVGGKPARKVGGILTEAVSTSAGQLRYAAIGIGINLNQTEFPAELADVATSLRRELGFPIKREELAIAVLRSMDTALTHEALESVHERFAKSSSWVRGKRVQVAEDEGYTGTTHGLTPEGLLRILCDDGTARVVRHGGVREL